MPFTVCAIHSPEREALTGAGACSLVWVHHWPEGPRDPPVFAPSGTLPSSSDGLQGCNSTQLFM